MSVIKPINSSIGVTPVDITPIKAFSDNYIWAITNKQVATLVDPGDASVCIEFLEKNQLILSSILITHHHSDHTGGINKLVEYCQQKQWSLTVYGPANENIPLCDVKLTENDTVVLDEFNINFRIIDLPGHTAGHIAYFANDHLTPILFCGDTLFSGGCGRLFEGSPEQMLNSLTKLANLPEHTQVYCTHEYTQANLAFALTVEPKNQALVDYNKKVNELRSKGHATIPSTIQLEKQINPFLRCNKQTIQASAQQFSADAKATSQDTFTTIRRWKDQF
ncbi:hydroxyacylglutathione hydrolase [Candidatus Colwellia aromaticivorans]|uniref:hydroxyacylglutathione hydrolase n=1 Tax=Candidatus Colwellia aromaticivorans TaxID=2267621 RepID=UPI000DF39880|nr:hydroxyacylglutathione hydrolase [Candidatus Colwellia aromaticivorans]